jgi:hypothetical protein
LKRPAHRQLNSSGQATKMWCLIGEKKPQAAASVELEGFTSSTAQPKKVIFFFPKCLENSKSFQNDQSKVVDHEYQLVFSFCDLFIAKFDFGYFVWLSGLGGWSVNPSSVDMIAE